MPYQKRQWEQLLNGTFAPNVCILASCCSVSLKNAVDLVRIDKYVPY